MYIEFEKGGYSKKNKEIKTFTFYYIKVDRIQPKKLRITVLDWLNWYHQKGSTVIVLDIFWWQYHPSKLDERLNHEVVQEGIGVVPHVLYISHKISITIFFFFFFFKFFFNKTLNNKKLSDKKQE